MPRLALHWRHDQLAAGRIPRSWRLCSGMDSRFATAAAIATDQWGRVAWSQLVAAGIDRHTIQRWLRDGRLYAVHHGVYAVGHTAASVEADYMAAVLAGGPGAVLSHRAAARVLRLLRRAAAPTPPPEITVPGTAGRRRPGIVIHRVRALAAHETIIVDGIPVTAVPRVLLDLAPLTAADELARLCHEAWIHHRTTPAQVESCIARYPHKKGAAKLRLALGSDVTLSRLESGFVRLLARHELPPPRTNVVRRGDRVDCHWPLHGLTVELLSYGFHASRHAFERDVARRRRSNHVAYTYGDVFERSAATIADLRTRLAASAPRDPGDPAADRPSSAAYRSR